MKEIKLKPSHWVALSCILLVLVVSLLAYSVYVPKSQEVERLKTQLTVAKIEQARLRAIPVPKKILPDDKAKLAALVPTEFDQSRFIMAVRDDERNSSVKLTELTFQEQGANDATHSKNALQKAGQQATTAVSKQANGNSSTTNSPAPAIGSSITTQKQSALTEQTGHLIVTGTYKQVRQFIEKFSQMSRLVNFNHWNLKTQDVAQSFAQNVYQPEVVQVPRETSNLNNDPVLSNRTPISDEKEYDNEMNVIMKKAATLKTQREKDITNLEIQQTQNRYLAGLLSQKESKSILDQEVAGQYIQNANTNIREVLGIGSGVPSRNTSAPTSLLGNPVTTIDSKGIVKTQVTLDIDFTIYYVPSASDLLPAPGPIKTYDPTERTDPVE